MVNLKILIPIYLLIILSINFAEQPEDKNAEVSQERDSVYSPNDQVKAENPSDEKEETKGDFIILKTGGKKYGEIEIVENFFEGEVIELDGNKIPLSNISAFQNDGIYYRILAYGMFGELRFAERVQKGRINLYKIIRPGSTGHWVHTPGKTKNTPYDPIKTPETKSYKGGSGPQRVLYYSKGDSEIKRAFASNLRLDLSENPPSIRLLNRRAAFMGIVLCMTGVGVTMFVVGTTKKYDKDSYSGFPPLSAAGIGIVLTTSIIGFILPDYKERAIESYNESTNLIKSSPKKPPAPSRRR